MVSSRATPLEILSEETRCWISSVRGATIASPDEDTSIGISFEEWATPRHLRIRSARIAVRATIRCFSTITQSERKGRNA